MLGREDDDLVIVLNSELCLTLRVAGNEWIRIRIVPSLTSYQLILSVPESHHKNTGALLIGNLCLEELEGYQGDLPGAQKEVGRQQQLK